MKKIILTAGGTGGHTLPALVFAKELMGESFDVHLVSDERGMRNMQVPEGLHLRILALKFYQKRGIFYKILGMIELLIQAFFMIFYLLKQKPQAVVGFGGFPSFPLLAAAWILRIPYALHEQNAVFGRVNRLFLKHAAKIFTSFPGTKGIHVGNPVRDAFLEEYTQEPSKKLTLLIMGGSQGASIFAKVIPEAIELLPKTWQSKLVIYQQARPQDKEGLIQKYQGKKATVETFFSNIPDIMKKADIIISRAGASTIAEIMALNKKALLLPYPFAMDNHQQLNAEEFVKMGYGWMVLDKDFTPEFLCNFLKEKKELPETKPLRADLAKIKNELLQLLEKKN